MSDPILVRCPQCQAKLRLANADSAGKKIRCGKCSTVFRAGSATANAHEAIVPAPRLAAPARLQGAEVSRPSLVSSRPASSKKTKTRFSATRVLVSLGCVLVLAVGAAAFLYLSGYWLEIFAGPVTAAKTSAPSQRQPPELPEWIQGFEAAKQRAVKEKKDILLSFEGSDWCGWCQRLEHEVRRVGEFRTEAIQKFILVKVDFPRYAPAKARVKDPAANELLQQQFNINGYPTVVLTDAGGDAYGSLGFKEGGVGPYLAELEKLRQIRIERDKLVAAVDQAEGEGKLKAAKTAYDFMHRRLMVESAKKHLPAWIKLSQALDANNDKGHLETFFAADWAFRIHGSDPADMQPLLLEMEEWKEKHGSFKEGDRAATVCLWMARGKSDLEDYESAFRYLDEGIKAGPKNVQVRQLLQMGPMNLGLSSGTAFAIDDSGHFLTNYHVAGGPGKVFLQFPDQRKLLTGRVVAEKADLDLAVVKIDLPEGQPLVPLRVASERACARGEQVGAWGFPLGTVYGHGLKMTKGGISALPEAANRNMLMLDLKVNPGNSGGPLCDGGGNVVGVVSARTQFQPNSLTPLESYGMAVTSKDVGEFLKSNKIAFQTGAGEKTGLSWEEIDRQVSPAVAMVIKAWPMALSAKELAFTNAAITIDSKLDNTDGRDPSQRQNFAKLYTVKLEGGKVYQIDMTSKELYSFLRVENAKRKQLAFDDDSGGGQDARIVFTCPVNGTYRIVATTFTGGATGKFALKIVETSTP